MQPRFKRASNPTLDNVTVTTRQVAYKIFFTIPNFDEHGDLTDYSVFVNGMNGYNNIHFKSTDHALQIWRHTYPYADQAINVYCWEGYAEVCHTVLSGQRWTLVGPWQA